MTNEDELDQQKKISSEFTRRIIAAAEPSVGEFFSDISNKVRLGLVGTSALAILLTSGAIELNNLKTESPVTVVEFDAGPQFTIALAIIICFLLVLYVIRYFVDRYYWNAKKLSGDFEILKLDLELIIQKQAALEGTDGAPAKESEVFKNHWEFRNQLYIDTANYAKWIQRARRWLEIPFPFVLGCVAVGVLVRNAV